jgi:hypothetical protein
MYIIFVYYPHLESVPYVLDANPEKSGMAFSSHLSIAKGLPRDTDAVLASEES